MQDREGQRVFLADFGLAKSVATGGRLTRTGQALGTPAYMSPEQARGEVSGLAPSTDVWSLGCVLYAMLAGRSPFDAVTPEGVMARILTVPPSRLRALRPDVPRPLERVVAAALAKAAGSRYPDGRALREDLDRLLRGEPPRAPRPGRVRRSAVLLGAAAAVAAGAAALAAGTGRPAGPGPAVADRRAPPEDLAARARALALSDPRAGAEILGRALEADPGRDDLRAFRGVLLWAVGEVEAARREWASIPESSPHAATARLHRGLEGFFRMKDGALGFDEGVQDLEAVSRTPGREGRIARATLAVRARRFDEARELLRDCPGWEAAALRGYVAGISEDSPNEEIREYDRALAEGIPFAWIHSNRGVAKEALGDVEGALRDADAALRLHPRYPIALNNRGNARALSGDRSGALEDFDAALELDPGLQPARLNRGATRFELGNYAGALADADAAVRLAPGDPAARRNRGHVRAVIGDQAGLVEDFSELVRLGRGDVSIHNQLGLARAALGDSAGAVEEFGRALRLGGPSAVILNNRGASRATQGDAAGAVADFTEALRVRPAYPEAFSNRGAARRRLGDLDGAVEDLEAAIRLRPGFAEAYRNLALARRSRRDWSAAAAAAAEFLRLDGDGPAAPGLRALLAECEGRLQVPRGGARD